MSRTVSSPELFRLLEQFREEQQPGALQIPDTHFQPGFTSDKKTLVLSIAVHGNEFGSLPAALRLMTELKSGKILSACNVYIILGNRRGAELNLRFVEEDLNRVFTFDRAADTLERKRAEELRPLLDQADLLLDIHQTQTPTTSAFYTFPWNQERGYYARALGAAPLGLTRKSGERFSKGMCCLDEYVRDQGKTAFTVEIGYRGLDKAQSERAYQAMVRLIEIENELALGKTLKEIAQTRPKIQYVGTHHVEKRGAPDTFLRPGLSNFSPVKQGDVLTPQLGEEFSWPGFTPRNYRGETLVAPATGVLLFPKYPIDGVMMPQEIYRLATDITDPNLL